MGIFDLAMTTLMAATAISLALTTARLLLGPSIPDRAMAFDMIMIHVVALISMYAVMVNQQSLLDSVLVVALLGFLGTVALARYIEEGRN
ncbi:MAG: monovalent cation/H+ antiporter complex subunit F [Chloroflexi bacterium OHK40]